MITKCSVVGLTSVRSFVKGDKEVFCQDLYLSIDDPRVSGMKVLHYLLFNPKAPVALGDEFVCCLDKYGNRIESLVAVESIL